MPLFESIEELLAPVEPDEFFRTYYGKKPLVISGRSPDFYGDLLTFDRFESLIHAVWADSDFTRIREPNLVTKFVRKEPGMTNLHELFERVAVGKSLHLRRLHLFHRPIDELLMMIRGEYQRRGMFPTDDIDSMVFFSPPQSRALPYHVDYADLIILQLEGTKHWRFFGKSPYTGPSPLPNNDLAPPCEIDVWVKPGDLIYVPRGYIHHAHTADDYSMAISLGVQVMNWRQVAEAAVTKALNSMSALLGPVAPEIEGSLSEEDVREALRKVLSKITLSPGKCAENLTNVHRNRYLSSVSSLRTLAKGSLNSQSTLVVNGTPTLVPEPGGGLRWRTEFGDFTPPPQFAPLLEWLMTQQGPFKAAKLEEIVEDDAIGSITSMLLRAGIVRIP